MQAEIAPVEGVERDETTILPCRPGDQVLWLRGSGFLNDASDGANILDFWEIHPGDQVLITNQVDDLPPWFQLHPSEVRGKAALAMLRVIEEGRAASAPLDGPNVWRVMAGDRLVWTGAPRPGCDGCNGVLSIFDVRADCLVLGRPGADDLEAWLTFGAPSSNTPNPVALAAARSGLKMVIALGCPGIVSVEWQLG